MLNKYRTLIAAVALGFAALTLAETAQPTKEAREKMAQAHEKMAACLRSDRDIAECHREMMQACKENMGEHGCGMGMMGGHHGGHDKAAPATTTPSTSTKTK